ncbi:beta-lactamase/transpeptidase-like protein [Mycena rosella]|uniref:Beta-lactamase/transpeptidase-like protein n=1 Tax=Mycena rosella TaxID=1033263 RepID=A0AAD7CUY3_MYCRO|nr:beta-lactamase/transpeptidase-like protein [Mycena rosella]
MRRLVLSAHCQLIAMTLLGVLLSLLPVVCAIQIPFQRPHPKGTLITPEIDQFVNAQLSHWNSSGLAVAVVRQDTSAPGTWNVEFGSYGTGQADGARVTPDTVFAIASNSKLFLSLSVGLLINNASLAAARGEKLRWDTKIGTVLPEWGLMEKDMQNGVTIQDMLSHRTGMPRHDYSGFAREGGVSEMASKIFGFFLFFGNPACLQISTLRFLRPSAALREQYQYNNLMYETLSHLPATLLNQTFESYITEHLFAALRMDSSTYSVAEAEARGTFAHGFHWDMQDHLLGLNGTKTATVPYFQRPGEEKIWAGAAGGHHPATNETVVPEDVVEHVALGVSVARGKAAYPELSPRVYGCGQDRFSYRGHEIIEHGGSNPGFKTQVARFPNDNLGIVVLSNDESGSHILESVKWKITDHVLGLEPIDWAQRYADELAESIRKNQAVTPRPSPPIPPSVPFSAMEGTFHHGAYGSISPCFVQSRTAGLSAACTAVLRTPVVQRILRASAPDIPTLIVPFPRTFSTHLRLAHFSGNVFNASLIWSNGAARAREGYPAGGDVVVGLDERYAVEWVAAAEGREEGFAFTGDFWGKEGEVRPLEGEGKDAAEVWFGRVD